MNLAIPDAAMDLGVSETRLRKTLAEGQFVTEVAFRQTRTGVRKTVMLPPATLQQLHQHYRMLEKTGMPAPVVAASAWLYPPADNPPDAAEYPASPLVRESAEEAAYLEQKRQEKNRTREEAPAEEIAAACGVPGAEAGVPVAQFHALLYQHNVLREDLGRMQHYLSDCEHLLEEMIKTIVTLEERMQRLETVRPSVRPSVLSGALRSVWEGVGQAFPRSKPAASRPSLQPGEVYYANVLSRP